MNIFYKILLFSILSFTFPIGKIFEIFIWNDRIVKIETEFQVKNPENKKCFWLFINLQKYLKDNLIFRFHNEQYFIIKEKLQNIKTHRIIAIQQKCLDRFKNRFIRCYLFNVQYSDDTEAILLSYT